MTIAENLSKVQDSIALACRTAGRPRSEVALVAVSKTHPVHSLLEAAAAGHLIYGENKVQEFAGKFTDLVSSGYSVERGDLSAQAVPNHTLQVHLIGHLQSNKAARAVELFTGIDTLDSLKLAERLHQAAARIHRRVPVLIEIKLSHEPAKEGLAPESGELVALLQRLPDLTQLVPRGLMTVAPYDANPDVVRACFHKLRLLRDRLAQQHPRLAFDELSMGMSSDFAIAIEEGSTQVRIGTAIFGARPRPGDPSFPR